MKLQIAFLCAIFISIKGQTTDPDTGLNTVQMIESHGYPSETHYITTEDGYILTYYRIPHGLQNDNTAKRTPVLLMHGTACSSADYVNMGPDRSLGYILADLGYDVWLANARGNALSRNHTTLDVVADAEKFFDFSWHEIGYYDLPAAVDYILNISGQNGLFYAGHSLGTTVFLVLATTRPEYNDKIKLASLLAPIANIEHQANDLLIIVAQYIEQIEQLLMKYKIYEVPLIGEIRNIGALLCPQDSFFGICKAIVFGVVGTDDEEIDQKKVPVLFTNTPSNNPMKPFYHLSQLIKNGGFSQYDYGSDKNIEIYGTETPPPYDLSLVSAPVALYYGKNDKVVDSRDVEKLATQLPNVVNNYPIPFDAFNHIDFLWAIDVKELLYDELIKIMLKYE